MYIALGHCTEIISLFNWPLFQMKKGLFVLHMKWGFCMSSFWLAKGLLLRRISTYDAWDASYPSKYKNAHVNLSELKSFKTPLFIVLLCHRFYYATFLVFVPILSHHIFVLSKKNSSKRSIFLHRVITDGFNCTCTIFLEFNFWFWPQNIF